MLETSARLLRLLSLLQARRDWTGAELADRLGVTTRTIRNDVERLRELGYPVDARPGVAGGYRLGAGGALPPLLLDDDEAVAVAVGLRTAASGSVAGHRGDLGPRAGEVAAGAAVAAAPPDQRLPVVTRCRCRRAARGWTRTCSPSSRAPAATTSGSGSTTGPTPARPPGGRWSRTGWSTTGGAGTSWRWDLDRDDWRTFRVDRIEPRTPTGPRFTPRELPPDREIAAQVARGVGEAHLAVPRAGDRARARGPRARPAADPGGRGAPRRGPVRVRARLGPSGDARALPGHARRRLHDRRLAGTA